MAANFRKKESFYSPVSCDENGPDLLDFTKGSVLELSDEGGDGFLGVAV